MLSDADGALLLLDRLGDPQRSCSPATLREAYVRLAHSLSDIDPPAMVRVAPSVVVPADQAVVLDAPYALPLLGTRCPVAGGAAVADLLDLPLASQLAQGRLAGDLVDVLEWRHLPGVQLAAERLDAEVPAATVKVHRGLTADGVPVDWWPHDATDYVDAAAGPAALGRALAWRVGRWELRAAAVEALAQPRDEQRLRAEDAAAPPLTSNVPDNVASRGAEATLSRKTLKGAAGGGAGGS